MPKEVLVAGDSYARLDPDAGHWANKWCKDKEYQITNFGLAGANHVSVVNEIFTKDWQRYDLIIYCMTSWLRAGVSDNSKNSAFLERVCNFLDDAEKNTFGKLLSKNILDNGYKGYANLSGFSNNHQNPDTFWTKETTNLYKNISIPFLARSNLFAVETLILKCKIANIPLVLATTPNDPTTIDNFKNYDTNIFVVSHNDPVESDLPIANSSSNHLSQTMHTDIQNKFNSEYGDII